MAQVAVTIDGKSYRMACDDGQEDHLTALAALYDGRIQDMRTSFGEIGDMRLAVMAAITVADELADTRAKLEDMKNLLAEARAALDGHDAAHAREEQKLAMSITALAERVERISKSLSSA
jgi:cell division protein ZapA